jgi:hypothetical protein
MSGNAETEVESNKKQKIMASIEESPNADWPEAWFMEEGETIAQKAANRQEPNKAATVEDLRKLGIKYWKMDADSYSYPVKAVPWDPKDAVDPRLSALRDDSKLPVLKSLSRISLDDASMHRSADVVSH